MKKHFSALYVLLLASGFGANYDKAVRRWGVLSVPCQRLLLASANARLEIPLGCHVLTRTLSAIALVAAAGFGTLGIAGVALRESRIR